MFFMQQPYFKAISRRLWKFSKLQVIHNDINLTVTSDEQATWIINALKQIEHNQYDLLTW